ncbi:Uncharacterized protein SCF082_LOCUS52654 [Durusdinium trenchii]|uniref:Uncharacterized protein n=1 Tax=Durusdinium trenchii TaxID=1381693 RepID=A0ABP0SML9_9DINO
MADDPEEVILHRVEIDGTTVTVEYSKNFATCGHLYNDSGQPVHSQNIFCTEGQNVIVVEDISKYTSLAVGDVVRMQHGNNSAIHSDWVTVTEPTTCPLEEAAQDFGFQIPGLKAPRLLSTVRSYRDRILSQSPSGRILIALYYEHSNEVKSLLAQHPDLGLAMFELVVHAEPALRSTKTLELEQAVYVQGLELLDRLATVGSPNLTAAIEQAQLLLKAHSMPRGPFVQIEFRTR